MKNQKMLIARHSFACALARPPLVRSFPLGLVVAFGFAGPVLADSGGNLAELNQLASSQYGESATAAYGGISSILGTPISQIAAFTPAQLAASLNAGLANGDVNNFTKKSTGINVLAGTHQISVADAAAAQAAYNSDHNVAELLARLYAGIGVNLQSIFGSISNPVAPNQPITTVSANVFQTSVVDKIKTTDEEAAGSSQNAGKFKILGLHPTLGATSFFEQSNLKAGGSRDLYGVNLGAEGTSDRVRAWLAVPLQWTTYASDTYMTYGVDVGAKYELIEDSGLYLGAHGTYLANNGDGSLEDYDWQAGPFIGYTYKFNDKYSISTGVLADYIQPQESEDTWLGGFGVNLGVRLTDHIALNTYYTYWRDLGDDTSFLGVDWHDVGVDFTYTVGKSWRLVLGAKSSLGYEGYESDYQIHAGAGWQF